MMRKSARLWQGIQPELHRYSHATFHEGTHRQAPGDSTPWRDVSSPVNRFRAWWLAPAAKGSVIAAWCLTCVIGAYCFSIQQDAKGTYLLNNVLLRNLHEESQRANANEGRAGELQEAMRQYLSEEKSRKRSAAKLEEYVASSEKMKAGIVNYELELVRERGRADAAHERNQQLLRELMSVRREMAQVQKDNATLVMEVEKLQRLLKRFGQL
ncbi:hypothetical protein conserved [Leishmania donovani]|uniref:Uncharacterized protein n=4 Tax=Leishmania donovani species complex TaxID=38574 RepID=A4IB78_LEIIN|nr:conserved hypothetical protein [Leishmania infantum JPCM5]XP_003864761.1 hypothetical protein, conserved [Leishmania donovani]CAC9544229.1 hypothetical_protein_-_conserved [Leishmania infantum]AYU82976.1 hypothetical protein LdCL_350022600 [Leishmania donovani]CAJ1992986.1 hypothetical protein conserved [Leishmania donovani]CAM72092.1 conserved hypothetical protein [Leishmania infantum JPCM5]CBZ38081.1 hypothetical protein, conserved [Leishmania donovani]|eukprot:XP_001468997.1 conserved hypothetical protein [Leishmania infantum JPCM5]